MEPNTEPTVYNRVVIPSRLNREYNPSRPTRPSNNPVLRESFSAQKYARQERTINYPQIEIGRPDALTQVYRPNVPEPKPELIELKPEPKPELIEVKPEPKPELTEAKQEPGEELVGDVAARKYKTLDHKNLSRAPSSVRDITHNFEAKTAQKSRSYTLNRGVKSGRSGRRTSVRELAQIYDTMAEDNRRDQLTQTTSSLTRSTSYYKKKAVMRTATDYINLTPLCSGPSSSRASPQLYMNVSPRSPLKTSSSCYENWTISESSSPPMDSYEEVFPGKYKCPETGEIVKATSANQKLAFGQSSLEPEVTNQNLEPLSEERRESTFQKPRAETIATIGMEECETPLGRFSLTFHPTESDSCPNSPTNQMRGFGASEVTIVVYKTRICFSGVNTDILPSNIFLMDLLMFQLDPLDSQFLILDARVGNEFQTHKFSSPSNALDDVMTCLREAVTEEKTSSLQNSESEEYFAILLGCTPVSSGTGQVARGVEQILTTLQLTQSIQVRLDVRDGMQMHPFGRSQAICAYRQDAIKGVAVWESDPRVLGVVAQLRTGRFLCYALRFNRANQLQAAFSSIRHFCKGEVAEEKKKNAWYMNIISKKKPKSQTNSESGSRPSTPTVDQIDPDTFTLLYLGTTQPDDRTFTSECIMQEHSNLLKGKNVSEMVSPPATTLLNVSDKCLRLTDKDKVHFLKRVYQRGMVVACLPASGTDNLLGLVTERKGTNELRCSIFRPLFSEAGHVAQHVTTKLKLTEN